MNPYAGCFVDPAWAVVWGAAIGALASIGASYVNHHLQTTAAKALDEKRKRLLKDMLSKGSTWRNLDTLQRVIGANEETTIRLLLEIGARGSQAGKPVWGLISRNPLPEIDDAD